MVSWSSLPDSTEDALADRWNEWGTKKTKIRKI